MRNALFTICLVAALGSEIAWAQSSIAPSRHVTAAFGSDMWTSLAVQKGYFTPHIDDCSGSEAFVEVGDSGFGYCIEKSERSTAQFEVARETCLAAGKRLPEPVEFKVACNNAGSLSISDMTDDLEWSTNFPITFSDSDYDLYGVAIAISGSGSCGYQSLGYVGASNSSPDSLPYRCVR